MTGSGRRSLPAPSRRCGAMAVGLLALMLAGCVDTTTAPWGVNLGDYQAPARDLVGVSLYSAEHVIRLGPGGTVSQAERSNLATFLTTIAYNRPESVRIVVHGRATPAQRSALAAALTADGVGPEHILWARDGDLGGRCRAARWFWRPSAQSPSRQAVRASWDTPPPPLRI